MRDPILISDGEEEATPPPKRTRKNTSILNLDTDLTPSPGFASTPLLVDDEDVTVLHCSFGREINFSSEPVISLESDSEDAPPTKTSKFNVDLWEPHCGSSDYDPGDTVSSFHLTAQPISTTLELQKDNNTDWMQGADFPSSLPSRAIELDSDSDKEDTSVDKMAQQKQTSSSSLSGKTLPKRQMSKDERIRATEEKKLRKEQEKLQKAASKAEEAEQRKLEKEKQKWEKGKLALKSIIAEIDLKLFEGSVGAPLISMFREKGITYRATSNPIKSSIVWRMTLPDDIARTFPLGPNIPYVLLVYEAEEFCNLVANERLLENVARVGEQYPSYTVCYLTNKLMPYVKKREREEFNNPVNHNGWRKPPIDEVLAKLTTHYIGVRSRHCVDDAEVGEHVVGLTTNLACCLFRKKLTRLSVNANGASASKGSVDKHLIKDSPWLKALVAVPKVQPRYAVSVGKKYPCMKSLLKVYMDSNISVHEKEFLLKDLKVEGLVGGDKRLGEVCSKRIYRVLMSPNGTINTDEVENGAALFTLPSYDIN